MFKPVTQPIGISSVVNACVFWPRFWLKHKDHTRTDIDIMSDIHGFYLVLCLRHSPRVHYLGMVNDYGGINSAQALQYRYNRSKPHYVN